MVGTIMEGVAKMLSGEDYIGESRNEKVGLHKLLSLTYFSRNCLERQIAMHVA